jgi:hypothetical protein
MFAVEINKADGSGWVITDGPIPRKQARDLKRAYLTRIANDKRAANYRVRVVSTGEVKQVDV